MLITKTTGLLIFINWRFEIQKCALNATRKHNRAIVCTSCDRSNTLQYTQAVFLHWIGPIFLITSSTVPRDLFVHAQIRCVRETDTFLELIRIKGIPYFHSVLLNRVNKQRPVTSHITDVAMSVKTSLFLIAVREKPEKKKIELIKHNSQIALQKLYQNR